MDIIIMLNRIPKSGHFPLLCAGYASQRKFNQGTAAGYQKILSLILTQRCE